MDCTIRIRKNAPSEKISYHFAWFWGKRVALWFTPGTNYALHNVVQWSINRMHSFSSSKSVENGDQKILISHFIFCKNQRFHKILFEVGIQYQRILLKTNEGGRGSEFFHYLRARSSKFRYISPLLLKVRPHPIIFISSRNQKFFKFPLLLFKTSKL